MLKAQQVHFFKYIFYFAVTLICFNFFQQPAANNILSSLVLNYLKQNLLNS